MTGLRSRPVIATKVGIHADRQSVIPTKVGIHVDLSAVIPTKVGIHCWPTRAASKWIPAFAGMTAARVFAGMTKTEHLHGW